MSLSRRGLGSNSCPGGIRLEGSHFGLITRRIDIPLLPGFTSDDLIIGNDVLGDNLWWNLGSRSSEDNSESEDIEPVADQLTSSDDVIQLLLGA
jgi:hypothetical protein